MHWNIIVTRCFSSSAFLELNEPQISFNSKIEVGLRNADWSFVGPKKFWEEELVV